MVLIAMVGKPSAGKSTFFKASSLAEVDIANYPFTTIKPNHGIGFVKIDCADKFFGKQCNPRVGFCINHKRFVPVDLIDVAGLVPDAHKGEGMGLEFLNDLNQADALIHIIDISGSTDIKGNSVDALSHDPCDDVRFLEDELDYWYLGILKKGWEKFARQIQQEHKEIEKALAKQLSGLKVNEEMVKKALSDLKLKEVPAPKWTEEQMHSLARALRIESKPMLIAANKIDVPGAEENLRKMKEKFPEYTIIGCSAESELALKEADKHELIKYIPGEDDFELIDNGKLNDKQKNALNFIKDNVLKKFNGTGVQDVINAAVLDVLGFIAIFPGGVGKLEDSEGRTLPDCFLLPKDSTALDFAYSLHTDFGDGFIKAVNVKTKMPIGKDHKLEHGDVVELHAKK